MAMIDITVDDREVLDVPPALRLPSPALLPKAQNRGEAVDLLARALGLSTENPYRVIDTPWYGGVPLAYERLPHMVDKDRDARERYANFILPKLMQPYEIWETAYADGTTRPRFIGLFDGPAQVMVVVRIDRDGRVFWNYMQAKNKDMNSHREGVSLVYGR